MNTKSVSGPSRRRRKSLFSECQITAIVFMLLFPSFMFAFDKKACISDNDCKKDIDNCGYPNCIYPQCRNNTCICTDGTCMHYTSNTFNFGNSYFCGKCGEIGSNCSQDYDCPYPGLCYKGYCSCDLGYLVIDVCVHFDSLSSYKESMILFGVLVLIIFINRLFKCRKTLKRLACRLVRCGCGDEDYDDNETVVGYNPDSNEKSAAYTIFSREFNASSDDPDLAWALELSAQMANDPQRDTRAETLPRSRRHMSRNRSIRRGFGVYQQGSFSSRSSTRSNQSGRSDTDSSTFSSMPSSYTSSPLGTLRREALNDEINNRKRTQFYCLLHEPQNIEEVVLTRILTPRQTSSTSCDDTDSIDFPGRAEAERFPTGARPKQPKLVDKVNKRRNATSMDTSTFRCSTSPNFSTEESSIYSSARSTFSDSSTHSENTPSLCNPPVTSGANKIHIKSILLPPKRKQKSSTLDNDHIIIGEDNEENIISSKL